MSNRIIPFIAALAVLAAPSAGAEATASPGAALLKPFKERLKGALVAGMAEGPAHAVDACHLQAPDIAAALSVDGVAVGRTSHRLRNPANAGPAWATEALQAYLDDPAHRAPVVVALDGGREGYVEPIELQPLCLACHGSELAPPVQAAIDERYPEDQATGFEAGDLRGVFWVSYPAATE